MKGKEVQVVEYLLGHKGENLNINQVAGGIRMDYKGAYTIIERLEKAGVISLERLGKSSFVRLINKLNPVIFEAEFQRRQRILRDKNLQVALSYYESRLKTELYVLLLFGSFAKGKQTKSSDIDLMFIVPDSTEEEMEREISSITSTIPLRLHVNVFSEKDFLAMKNSREFTVGQEAIKNNIILRGIEAYYRLTG